MQDEGFSDVEGVMRDYWVNISSIGLLEGKSASTN
jgi:hypothetical protein